MTREKLTSVFLHIMAVVFTWVLVGQILQSQLTPNKLIKVTGIVDGTQEVATRVKKGLLYTTKDLELRIYLRDTAMYFRIMDVYKYQRFRGQIQTGDTALIYIRPKWLVPLGLGHKNDVFQLNINGKTIFDISQTHKNENGLIVISLIAIPLFIFLARRAKQKAREKEKQKIPDDLAKDDGS